MMSLLATTI